MPDDPSPLSASEAKPLFADLRLAPALVLAVSGGPDSVALLWLAARWRAALKRGPRLLAVTVDHQLRPEAGREAAGVKRLAGELGVEHRTVRWLGAKPGSGVPAAAREARYALLLKAARRCGADHILTAHTRDDQAETFLMRMARGSGMAGLGAMARRSPREGAVIVRPLLDVPKARLLATLDKVGIAFVLDPTNQDARYTRPRLRALMPSLAAEGCDAANLARLAGRLARANAALELMADGAERFLALNDGGRPQAGFGAEAFAGLAEEIRVRVLLRTIGRAATEGVPELGKVEALAAAIDAAAAGRKPGRPSGRLRQTLAGAVITVADGRIVIEPAPPRRRRGPDKAVEG
ncbi:MAG: tRNA lysidine(34) synthetase TilS [Xanthobacteraceae bacterium]|nr:tRNA lysidine(34) synthetase TilS [Xanthobacteraceae bacterium]